MIGSTRGGEARRTRSASLPRRPGANIRTGPAIAVAVELLDE
jgi:hypothetical protein